MQMHAHSHTKLPGTVSCVTGFYYLLPITLFIIVHYNYTWAMVVEKPLPLLGAVEAIYFMCWHGKLSGTHQAIASKTLTRAV